MYTGNCINDLIASATRITQQVSEPVSRRAHNPQSPVQLRNLLPISSDQNNYAEGCVSGKRTL